MARSLLLPLLLLRAGARPCPADRKEVTNVHGSDRKITVPFANEAGIDVNLVWVSTTGAEIHLARLAPGEVIAQVTMEGHVFKARAAGSGVMLLDYDAPDEEPAEPVQIFGCEGMGDGPKEQSLNLSRWEEFDALVHDHGAPCMGPSSNWSCVRWVSPEAVMQRDPDKYGYHKNEIKGTEYKVGQTVDHLFSWQAKYIVNVTPFEGGYLKMSMTENLKKLLHPWYEERKLDSLQRHNEIPGGFTNNKEVYFDIILLDRFTSFKRKISEEMQAVMEWWTKMRLRHSETFGVRIYRRGAMLVDHVDRQETHVASAILQVGQKVDEDGGWPLEAIHPLQPGRKEIYLQPGEMLLYEGARITHGRPMRFKGKEFGNIFVHFAPLSWRGLDEKRPNEHYVRTERELKAAEL